MTDNPKKKTMPKDSERVQAASDKKGKTDGQKERMQRAAEKNK